MKANWNPEEFIHSKKWQFKQKNILRRDNFMDQYIFKTTGRMENANTVHHILPKEDFPQYALEDWNLISVSHHTHSYILHNHTNGQLTNKGKQLMMETAFLNGIKLSEKIMVIGLPGSGKTTYVRDHLGMDGIAYDLDSIAGSFRLCGPHEDCHQGARRMANSMLRAFASKASKYASRVFIIRTAPTLEELSDIRPDSMVICRGKHDISNRIDFTEVNESELENRILDCKTYCEKNSIPVSESPPG